MHIIHPSYPALLDAIRRVFGAHAAVLFMPDETGRFTALAADCPDNTVKTGSPVEPGKGLVGWILRNRQPLIVNNFDQRNSHLGYYESPEEGRITAFMGCPLDNGGALCVDTAVQPRAFTEDHMEGLIALSALFTLPAPAAVDIEAVRRYFTRLERIQELRAQHAQWKTYLPAFLALVAEATRFDHVAFAARPDNSETYTIEAESAPLLLTDGASPQLPIAGGVAGWVFRNDVPVHTEGLNNTPAAALYGKVKGVPDFRSVVCLPVAVNRATTAALCLGGLDPRPIPQAMRSFIRMATDELVQFLEALYLRHRVRSLLPQARLHKDGATAYNPDTAPGPQQE
ncbi:MAG: GAF domain-containing protein [Deltaproteobacteria bacterium]|jgi:hypothetical protein|nr:GAF domain-containing protein [Deltaproteobacteria bacterium]